MGTTLMLTFVTTLSDDTLLDAVLGSMIGDKPLFAKFLNTLSYLEHIGSRKILQSRAATSEQYLRHAAEESRHAYFFRRAATQVLHDEALDDYGLTNLLAGREALGYFQRLDATVRSAVSGWRLAPVAESCYLLVTLLIEQRADALYPTLQRKLEANRSGLSLRSVIGEEDRHLKEMRQGISGIVGFTEEMLQELESAEQRLFSRFLRALAASLPASFE